MPHTVLADYIQIKGTVVNVRQGPGTSHPVLFQAEKGEEFDLVKTEGLWYAIRLQQGQEGWVFRKLVEVVPGSRPGVSDAKPAPEKPDDSPSVFASVVNLGFYIVLVLLTVLGIWKRKELLSFARLKLKEISGYKREQAFRYDNRKPSDDSWEL